MNETIKPYGFLRDCWSGNISPWKAFWLINVLGFVLALALAFMLQALTYFLFHARLPGIVDALIVFLFGAFSAVVMWRCTPDPQASVKGALAKAWVLLFSLYILSIAYKFTVDW